ncbi:uncharacterized protein RB166_019370 [Leptodactylus fuscus]|uniref:uncharacterized protein LOC142184380 n=1 Tax=Leptodactylus fuscus TaxID=238119 RepID=UPI003F4E9587
MTSWNFSLFSAFLYFLVAATAGQPSCNNVEDFGRCTGDTDGFCHSDIPCSCKGGQPFCSCPFYRGPNGNYWYLGKKCDHLWSTLDMIVVAVFPGVALAFVVAITAQLIHFCKTKPQNKTVKEPKKKSERKTTNTHQNEAFIPEEVARNQYPNIPRINGLEQVQPKIQAPQWDVPAAEAPNPRRMNYYNDMPPARRSTNYFSEREQPQNFGFKLPEQDYDGYDLRGQKQNQPQNSRFMIPPADYQQRGPEPSTHNAAWTNQSFSFARPQVRSNFDY